MIGKKTSASADRAGSRIDYQWIPTKQIPVGKDLQGYCDPMMGLAIDANKDWLLLTRNLPPVLVPVSASPSSKQEQNGSTLWRSRDEGGHWERVSFIPRVGYHEGHTGDAWGLFVTNQGRIITSRVRRAWAGTIPHLKQKKEGEPLLMREDPPGRFVFAIGSGVGNTKVYVCYSDDTGKTWRTTDFIDTSPLHAPFVDPCGFMHEAPNGDIIMPFGASLPEGEAYGWISCGNYVSSSDGGETWGKPVIIAKGDDERGQSYNEIAVLPRREKPWVCMVRMNACFRIQKPGGLGGLGGYRCLSYDQGKTWTLPEPVSDIIASPVLYELKDGSILFAASIWASTYMYISHDDGLSWSYQMKVPRSGGDTHCWIQPDEDTLVVAHKEITFRRGMLTWFKKQPTTKSILTTPPRYPEHRWTMRDLKNIYVDKNLKPYSSSTRLPKGAIVVAGVTGETKQEVFVISSTDPWTTWSAPQPVSGPQKLSSIYPACLKAIDENTLIIICTESDQLEEHNSPTILRTFVSTDAGKKWSEVSSIEEAGGIHSLRPGSGMIKDKEGNLVLPLSGIDDKGVSVCGTVHSKDSNGEWGSFQEIARGTNPEDILDQPVVLAIKDGHWRAMFRANLSEYRERYAIKRGPILRQPPLWQTTSTDEGATWSRPAHAWSAHYPHLLRLPDGALMLTSITDSSMQYQISYNEGASWSFQNRVIVYSMYHFFDGQYKMSDLSAVVLDDQTLLGTYFCDDELDGGPRIVAIWIRALPVDSPEARERGL